MQNQIQDLKDGKLSKEQVNELQQKLKKAYYENEGLISDALYDELFDTNTETIGYTDLPTDGFPILKHGISMHSLHKLKTYNDYLSWSKDKTLVVQPKFDGLSLNLNYEYGVLKTAILRGNGEEGENIIVNAKHFLSVPQVVEAWQTLNAKHVSVRGEIIVSMSNFNSLPENEYKNRRSAVSGISRRHDGLYSNLLCFAAFNLVSEDLAIFTETDSIQELKDCGFYAVKLNTELTESLYSSLADMRIDNQDYLMDGLVLKIDNLAEQAKLGFKDGRPLGQIALKYPPRGVQSTVTHYTWNTGSTGMVIPKIEFEPVDIDGSTISRAAMGSYQAVMDMGAGPGSIVEVKRMGDVIPKVTGVIKASQTQIEFPTQCPSCGRQLTTIGANLFCESPDCIERLYSKAGPIASRLGLKGIGSNMFYKMVELKIVQSLPDVFKLSPADLYNNYKISPDRALKVLQRIELAKRQLDTKGLLYLLDISKVSGKAVDKLAETVDNDFGGNSLQLLQFSESLLQQLIGNAKGATAYKELYVMRTMIRDLITTIKTERDDLDLPID